MSMKITKTAWPWVGLSVLIILLDQYVKYWVLHHVTDQQTISLLPFLNIILRFNSGAAFSFLGNQDGWQVYFFSVISVLVSVVLFVWLCRLCRSDWMVAAPVSLVLGGALGNLIDRIHYGFVVDFIDFHINLWHFATFNIADSAVCVGAACLILRVLYEGVTRQS